MVNLRASMLDDERYPIAVSPDELPTIPRSSRRISHLSPVANNERTRGLSYAETPVSAIGSSHLSVMETATNPVSPITYNGDPSIQNSEVSWKTPAFDSKLLRAEPKHSSSMWRQFNVWKVLLFGLMTFAAGVVITMVVMKDKMKSSKAASAASAAARPDTTTSTLLSSSTTASVASSGLFLQDGVTWNMQVYYQPANTTKIMYRMNLQSGEPGNEPFETARNMSLSILPKTSSPITATAATDATGVVYLNVFYITSNNVIAQASVACPVNSAECRTTSNVAISSEAQALHQNSSLAAVNVDNAQDWRIYYQNANLNVVELAGNSSGFNQGVTIYSGPTLTGSSLTAVNIYNNSTNNINVFFVDHDSQALFYTQYTSDWQAALPVTKAVVDSWNPTSRLASAYASTPGWMRVYYVGNDSKVWEYIGYNASTTNTTWEVQPGTGTPWIASNEPTEDITATAFEDQVRWWQYGGNGLLEAALDNTTWVENRVL